jgi:hypothetical protein
MISFGLFRRRTTAANTTRNSALGGRRACVLLLAGAGLIAGCNSEQTMPDPMFQGQMPAGTVDMREVQIAYIGSGSGGTGTLTFQNNVYPFRVGGLGVGGVGLSAVDAKGYVYNLQNPMQFAGRYAQGRIGFAVGQTSSGDLWLQNESGVMMHLVAKRQGLMLSLGADAMVISFQ